MRKILFFILFSSVCFSQKKEGQALIDSLLVILPKLKEDTLKVNLLNDLAYSFRDINSDKHIKHTKEALQLATQLKYTFGIVAAHHNIGIYNISFDNGKANENFQFVLKNAKNKSQIAKAYFGLGCVSSQKGNFPESLNYYFKGLKIAEDAKDYKVYVKLLLNIGVVYHYSSDYEKAISYYKKGLEINKKHKNIEDDNLRLHHIGLCYIELKQYEKALINIDEAEKINDKLGLLKFKASCKDLKGDIYSNQENYSKALEIYKNSLKIYLKINDEDFISHSYSRIGETYTNMANANKITSNLKKEYLSQAVQAIEKVIVIDKKGNNLRHLSESYSTLSEIRKYQGNFEEALKIKNLSYKLRDSVFNTDNKETIKNLEDKREIELRDKQIKINKLSLESKEKQKWFFISALALLGIIGGLLYYQSRNRRKTNIKLKLLNGNLDEKVLQLDQANKTKTRFFNILNHDLRGPVSNLIDFLQIQKNTPEILDEETKNRIQDTTLSSAENLLVSMEDILLWSKGQMENFKPQLKNIAVNQLFEDTKKVFSGYIKISFEYHNPDNIEIFTDENYLKTIIRNLTSNAINVFTTTENPIIIWKAWQENGTKYLSVTDNGPGATLENFKALYDDTQVVGIKSGLGLHLIRDLAKAIDCEISVDSKINVGTTFTLKF